MKPKEISALRKQHPQQVATPAKKATAYCGWMMEGGEASYIYLPARKMRDEKVRAIVNTYTVRTTRPSGSF